MTNSTTQLSLPGLALRLADRSRHNVGTLGEVYALRNLEQQGYRCQFTQPGEPGDIRAVEPETGEVIYIEVKTARRSKRGKWLFGLMPGGTARTNAHRADLLVLLATNDAGAVTPFVVPTSAVSPSQTRITMTSLGAGKWAGYRALSQWGKVLQ